MNTETMMRGLVRAAESKEERDGGKIWDDECRLALEEARRRGWGKNRVGTMEEAREGLCPKRKDDVPCVWTANHEGDCYFGYNTATGRSR